MKSFLRSFTRNPKNDILSGLTVALALVPEAVAFSFVAGVDPLVGLYGAFMMGLITAIFGGRPGMISGATGAMAVVMVYIIRMGNDVGDGLATPIEDLGLQWLFITLLLVGTFQIMAGLFKLGKFVRLIPHPVMMGFVNGLAIVIFLSQMGMFKEGVKDVFGNDKYATESVEKKFEIKDNQVYDVLTNKAVFLLADKHLVDIQTKDKQYKIHEGQVFDLETKLVVFNLDEDAIFTVKKTQKISTWIPTQQLLMMLGLILLTMLIMWGLPKLTEKVPSALVAIIVVACITIFGDIDVSTVGSFIRAGGGNGLEGSLPTFQFQIFGLFETLNGHWFFIIKMAAVLAAIGLIESLMTLNLIDDITESRGSGNRECVAQGGANILNGLFGGMGGCAMIGQSIINVESGGSGRLSGVTAAVALLCFVLFGAPLIEQIPIAALVGVMFMVVIGTFAWSSFRILHKIPMSDAFVLIAVSAITVVEDLAVAVIAGVIMSALVFAWKNAIMIRARKRIKEDGTKVYEIWGPLFFGSVQNFTAKFDAKNDPDCIEIDFIESKVNDHSGIEAIRTIANKYLDLEKDIKLTHLSPECQVLLLKANQKFETIIEKSIDDPRYHVVTSLEDLEV